jgi:integrase
MRQIGVPLLSSPAYPPLSSRGLGRRILSPETRVRIPVAVLRKALQGALFLCNWRSADQTVSRNMSQTGRMIRVVALTTVHPVSGHVLRVERARGPRWYMKYRLPDGRQVQRLIGPAWTSKREAPPPGHFTKRGAQQILAEVLAQARRGELGGVVRSKATLAEAAEEWLRYVEHDRQRKASTVVDYRHMVNRINRELGAVRLADLTPERIEAYRDGMVSRGLANRTINKYLVVLHAICRRAMKLHGLPANPVAMVEKRPNKKPAHIDVFSREEVMALVGAAESELDGALYMTAAFTGLRMGELLALRWRDVDFELDSIHVRRSFTGLKDDTPKSGRERTVPMASEVAERLARLRRREHFTSDEDLVFCGQLGGHLNSSDVRSRYKRALGAAGLRQLRFHDLRHTFGTHAIRNADSREVMEWMGHQDLKTTQIYLSYKSQRDAARRISDAFRG